MQHELAALLRISAAPFQYNHNYPIIRWSSCHIKALLSVISAYKINKTLKLNIDFSSSYDTLFALNKKLDVLSIALIFIHSVILKIQNDKMTAASYMSTEWWLLSLSWKSSFVQLKRHLRHLFGVSVYNWLAGRLLIS